MPLSDAYTINIFRQLHRALPPLVPTEIQRNLRAAATEAALIRAGKSLWPYRRAFQELMAACEEKMGEIFFVSHLTSPLKERFRAFGEHGGHWRSVWSGRSIGFFAPDDRATLAAALIDTRQRIWEHAAQMALSVQRQKYEAKIEALERELAERENELIFLRSLAQEQSDSALAKEIDAYIEACEHGLCGLEPEVTRHSLARAREHFQGRRADRRMSPTALPSLNFNHVL